MSSKTPDPDQLADELEAQLEAVSGSEISTEQCLAWARALPADRRAALSDRRVPGQRLSVATTALDVMCWEECADRLRRADLEAWLGLMRHPRLPSGEADALAELPGTPVELADRSGVLVPFLMEGLGLCRGWMVESQPPGWWFSCWWSDGEVPATTGIELRPVGDRTAAASALFETLGIDDGDTTWLHPDVVVEEIPIWTLLRTDDNANCVTVMTSRSRAKAIARAAELEATGHRQLYEVVVDRS